MKELVDTQFRNVERAFTVNTGPYVVSQDYKAHFQNPSKWVKALQRDVHYLYLQVTIVTAITN